MLAELLASPGVEELCDLRSRFGIMAIHGGHPEKGTAEIAGAAAEAGGASFYAIRQPIDFRWHLPSATIDPAQSEAFTAFIDHVDAVISVHGYGRPGLWTTVLVGGQNRELAGSVAHQLRTALGDGFTIEDDLEAIPVKLRGVHPRNPVNAPRRQGVQLELPPRVRPGIAVPTFQPEWPEAIVGALATVARSWNSASSSSPSKAPPTTSSSPSPG